LFFDVPVQTGDEDVRGTSEVKLKEPALIRRLFQLRRRRREIALRCNFIMYLQNMLDAFPTSLKRLHNVFYEPFLRDIQLEGFSPDVFAANYLGNGCFWRGCPGVPPSFPLQACFAKVGWSA
jgi:hypothetical protein